MTSPIDANERLYIYIYSYRVPATILMKSTLKYIRYNEKKKELMSCKKMRQLVIVYIDIYLDIEEDEHNEAYQTPP
jgi:hypothetical protein